MPAAHLAPAPATPLPAPGPDWQALSEAMTAQLPPIAGRAGLTVTCAPGAGHGAPGCFIPDLDRIEIDGRHLRIDPGTADPASPADRDRYPAVWGVLTHEAAHATHTRWTGVPPASVTAAWGEAAMILEESRIEAAQLAGRPGDRHWLRASATEHILDDFTAPPAATCWDAGQAAALLIARADAGVLDEAETAPVTAAAEAILGPGRLARLREVWRAAHTAADTDARAMSRLGRRWCRILGTDPDTPRPVPLAGPGPLSALAEAIADALTAVASADAPPAGPPSRAGERAAEKTARDSARAAAEKVFSPRARPPGSTRPPAAAEQAAARRLARALRAAASPERTTATIRSATPPGRLAMREALAASAQRAAGARPAAEPFTRTLRRRVPAPPLRAGIACDVSGSMSAFAGPVASAAWITSRAASLITGTRTATVTYGERVRPVTRPGRAPSGVTEFAATDGTEMFCQAIDALDYALDLSRPGAARLLVIVSDGQYTPGERRDGQQRITRLASHGCAILWLAPGTPWDQPMDHARTLTLDDPDATADAIARAATRALATPGA